jgi:hypothetical protein
MADPSSSTSGTGQGSSSANAAAAAGKAPSSSAPARKCAPEPKVKQKIPPAVRQQMYQELEHYAPRVSNGAFMSQMHKKFKENGRGKAWYGEILARMEYWSAENGHGNITVADVRGPASK